MWVTVTRFFPVMYMAYIETKPKGFWNKLFNISGRDILHKTKNWKKMNQWQQKWWKLYRECK